mmetsp:Transcript_11918/g.32793  ORF Transcript_11918/g.32793 Transcript_11918/m.32793 type:complete len:241 (+) Transcript_11918:501-1223(+)
MTLILIIVIGRSFAQPNNSITLIINININFTFSGSSSSGGGTIGRKTFAAKVQLDASDEFVTTTRQHPPVVLFPSRLSLGIGLIYQFAEGLAMLPGPPDQGVAEELVLHNDVCQHVVVDGGSTNEIQIAGRGIRVKAKDFFRHQHLKGVGADMKDSIAESSDPLVSWHVALAAAITSAVANVSAWILVDALHTVIEQGDENQKARTLSLQLSQYLDVISLPFNATVTITVTIAALTRRLQ